MGLEDVVEAGAERSDMRTVFCRTYVMPHTARAAKYISLYRRLRRDETVVQYSTVL